MWNWKVEFSKAPRESHRYVAHFPASDIDGAIEQAKAHVYSNMGYKIFSVHCIGGKDD